MTTIGGDDIPLAGPAPELSRADRQVVRAELQEMVDSLRAARVFATIGDVDALRRALLAHRAAADRLLDLIDRTGAASSAPDA